MAGPRVFAIVLDGTNAITQQLQTLDALEVIPGGSVTVQVRIGDGNDNLPLLSGASYVSPPGVKIPPGRLTVNAASATTATVIAWTV